MIPKNELPREKIIKFGIESLSDLELLVLVIGFGNKSNDVFSLAQNVLKQGNGLANLANLRLGELLSLRGLKIAKATKIMATFEIARRINSRSTAIGAHLKFPLDIYRYLKEILENNNQEQFFLIMLNAKYRVLAANRLFVGSLDMHIIHPRDIFREAVKNNAKFIICAHNHPSGDTTPSLQDIETTKAIDVLGQMMGIKLIDHLIISVDSYRSLKQENYF